MFQAGRIPVLLGRFAHRTTVDAVSRSQQIQVTGVSCQSLRFYKKRNSVRIPPTKPIYFGHSGDRTTTLDDVDLTRPTPTFEKVKDLENASEEVKKMCSLEFADGDVILEKRIQDIRKEVQEHDADIASLEVAIAERTIKLRNGFRHTTQFRKDKVNKSRVFRGIVTRNRMLKELRDVDYEKFLWMCEKLDIVYTPPNPYRAYPLGRRAMRKKVAREQMISVQRAKLAELEKQLEKEKVVFLKEKDEEMKTLEAEMRQMGVSDFTDTETVLKQLLKEEYEPPVKKTRSRRELILAKKFELYGKSKKDQPM